MRRQGTKGLGNHEVQRGAWIQRDPAKVEEIGLSVLSHSK
jgi:hypothetical protein